MASFPSSPIVTLAATDTRTADVLRFTFTARPQAMSIYARFVELGTILMTTSPGLWAISDTSSNNPRLLVFPTGGLYRLHHQTTFGTVTSTLAAAPAYGDTCELLATITAAGVVQLSQSVNGGAVSSATASSALVLAQAWSGQVLQVGAANFTGWRNLRIDRGVFDMPTMRRKAGV